MLLENVVYITAKQSCSDWSRRGGSFKTLLCTLFFTLASANCLLRSCEKSLDLPRTQWKNQGLSNPSPGEWRHFQGNEGTFRHLSDSVIPESSLGRSNISWFHCHCYLSSKIKHSYTEFGKPALCWYVLQKEQDPLQHDRGQFWPLKANFAPSTISSLSGFSSMHVFPKILLIMVI